MNTCPGEEAEMLRYHLWLMLIFHGFVWIIFDIWLYNFRFYLFFMELVYAYVCWQSVMTLENKFIYAYIALMYSSLLGFTQIAEVGNFILIIIFLVQMVAYVFVGGFITCRRLNALNKARAEGNQGDAMGAN